MSQYNTGTVAVTNGSAAIVGTGTSWLANTSAGDVFTIAGSNVPYVVGAVVDDTHITLDSNYAGADATGQLYSITTSFTPTYSLPYPEDGDIDTATILKRAMLMIDTLFTAAKTYAEGLVVGVLRDRGNYDASGNTFPASGGSGAAGAILKGDVWYISVAGTLGGLPVIVGDTVRALSDAPGQTAGNWIIMASASEDIAANIHAATAKTTPIDADEWGIWNSVTGLLNKVTFANLKATVKAALEATGMTFTGAVLYDSVDISPAPNSFSKIDSSTVAFTKTGADTLSIKADTHVVVGASSVYFASDTPITMPTLVGGTDYAIWVKDDATIQATTDFVSAPAAGNWRHIGGFHYGLVAAGTTVAGGSFATTGNGMIWTQADVDKIAGINQWSLWDLKFRPAAADPRGMVLVDGEVWVDIYLTSTDTDANGTSKYNTNIASGTVLPKIPTAFGGNGTTTYPSMNWWVANELARAKQKRLMFADEFSTAMFGVTENQSIDATASTYPTTQRNAGYTSKYGIEEASGHHWVWGQDSNFYSEAASPAGSWKQNNGNTGAAGSQRGETYTFGTYGLARVILGGARSNGAYSGSRASGWGHYPWSSYWFLGLRAACDHLISV